MSGATGIPFFPGRRVLRVGVTGLARAGKTAFLTSAAANLLAQGSGMAALPALAARLGGRSLRVAIAPSGAGARAALRLPVASRRAGGRSTALAGAHGAVSLLSLDLDIGRQGVAAQLWPPRAIRLNSSIIPASGCSTCRCWRRISRGGRPRRWPGWSSPRSRRSHATSWPSRAACPPAPRPTRPWRRPATGSIARHSPGCGTKRGCHSCSPAVS